MEVADLNKERSTLIIAVMTLVTIGLSLIISTGQTLSRQEEAGILHLQLSARSVLQAVESSLRTGLFVSPDAGLFRPGTAEYFRELERSGEVVFVGIIDERGGRVLTSRDNSKETSTILFPPDALTILGEKGEWAGRATYGKEKVFVHAKKTAAGSASRHDNAGNPLPSFLVVGLDMSKHMAVYQGFKQNALFQAAYILAAALFIWGLAMGLLKRRELAGRALQLERFQAKLLDNLPDGLLIVSPTNIIRAANPAAHSILDAQGSGLAGLSLEHLQDNVGECLMPPEEGPAAGWQKRTAKGAHLEILSVPLREHDEEGSRLVLIRDRTRMRELEKSLADAEKMAALGTLAAGVAHEIRNPLSSLRGFAQYFAKKFKGSTPDETYAQTMIREADRLNRVITDLLYLSRPRSVQPQEVSLLQLAEDINNLVRMDLEDKHVMLDISLESQTVRADEDLLKQAILNLVLNSLDALAESPLELKKIHIASAIGDAGVWIFVRDSGPGMTKIQKEQAFEPFFTTKSKGTGLGLALVHKTMREHGGKALIESEIGRGTTVALFFPDTDDAEYDWSA